MNLPSHYSRPTRLQKQDPRVLLLAGIDPTGHAGLDKDEEICTKLNTPYKAWHTAITQQTDDQFISYQPILDDGVQKYFEAIETFTSTKKLKALKIGMLGNEYVTQCVLDLIERNPSLFVVWDPVFQSSSGGDLINPDGKSLAIDKLSRAAHVVTPNRNEIYEILNLNPQEEYSQQELCQWFYDNFETAVYLKGGHFENKADDLFFDGQDYLKLTGTIQDKKIRGTGCALSTALACYYTKENNLIKAVQKTKMFMNRMFE